MTIRNKATAIGINHVALEVSNIAEALAFYGSFLNFTITSQTEDAAFINFGDQFINFAKGRTQAPDEKRHFGIAVDDKEPVRDTLIEMDVPLLGGQFLDFLDPWGNRIEITTYTNIMFSKTTAILRGMDMDHLQKTDEALAQLDKHGLGTLDDFR
ncbi:MAG: VOC family protein [Dehalococcoidia bacterium]|jgi:catechol 2,3-dioxygenase-like lactoylglutathione lyase family enzyme|nr:VOC family protein [Dehalococcoidia bacterium]